MADPTSRFLNCCNHSPLFGSLAIFYKAELEGQASKGLLKLKNNFNAAMLSERIADDGSILGAIAAWVEAIALRVEVIALRVEVIAIGLEAIAIGQGETPTI